MSIPVTPAPPVTGPGLYTKVIISAAVAAGGTLYAAQSDAVITGGEWIAIAITFLVNLGLVWAIPMTPAIVATYGKALASGLISGLGVVGTGLADGQGLQGPEITAAILAFIAGTGLVYTAPNALSSDPVGLDGKLVPISADVKAEIANEGTTQVTTKDGVVAVGIGSPYAPRRADEVFPPNDPTLPPVN